jgi:hypothetical protein
MIPLHNQRFSRIGLIVFGVLIISILQVVAPRALAADSPLLWLNPSQAIVPQGGIVKVVLQLDNLNNVYGSEISLDFDPNVLEVIDALPGVNGVQLIPGSCPKPDFIVENFADNTAGSIEYAVTQLSPTLPCDGGEMASITFRCLTQDGISHIQINESIIADPDLYSLLHSTQHGSITCLAGDQLFLPIVVMMD